MDAATRVQDAEMEKVYMRWQAAGHEVLFERNLFRHKTHRKSFSNGTVIKRNGIPFITKAGKTLVYEDVLPERGDLCLDLDANVVSPDEFKRRYLEYLRWFPFHGNCELEAEPIPDVYEWISQTHDTFSDSGGYVEIGFDATKPAETIQTHMYDPVNDKLVEMIKSQETVQDAIKFLLEKAVNEEPRRGPGRPRKEEEVH